MSPVHGAVIRSVPAPWIGLCLLVAGCTDKLVPEKTIETPAAPAASVASTGVPQMRHGLAWYDDAPDAARAAAVAARQLLVVELWAPWCHSCLSMKNFVLRAENLPLEAPRFTWLAIDTERAENAAFLERLPVGVWPTFYVVSPDDWAVHGRWLGAASPVQFSRFLSDSRETFELEKARELDPHDPRALARSGAEFATRGEFEAAAARYEQALRAAPGNWARRPDMLVAAITALSKAKAHERCVTLAEASLRETGVAASAVDFSYYALSCAAAKGIDAARASRLRQAVRQSLSSLCHQGSPELSPDDRADACDKLAATHEALSEAALAKEATVRRLAILERAADGKPDDVAVAYDWARTDALLALGRAEDALALSLARERALPRDYNPPHYLAKSYKQLGRWTDGLAAMERALALAYGPRRIGLLSLKADLLLGAGRAAEARAVLENQLELYATLPPGQRQPAAEHRVKSRLAELAVTTHTP